MGKDRRGERERDEFHCLSLISRNKVTSRSSVGESNRKPDICAKAERAYV